MENYEKYLELYIKNLDIRIFVVVLDNYDEVYVFNEEENFNDLV